MSAGVEADAEADASPVEVAGVLDVAGPLLHAAKTSAETARVNRRFFFIESITLLLTYKLYPNQNAVSTNMRPHAQRTLKKKATS